MPQNSPVLELVLDRLAAKNLTCIRGKKTLFSNIDLAVGAGELLFVEGPNGAGKTTLLRILCGLHQADQGQLYWHGHPLNDVVDDYRQSLLYIGHKASISKPLTPVENTQYWLSLMGQQKSESDVLDALLKVGLMGYEDVPCSNLSAGQARRVVLARLLLSNSLLWILDEPFVSLDKKGVRVLQTWFAEHLKKDGSILLTSHQALDPELLTYRRFTLGERNELA